MKTETDKQTNQRAYPPSTWLFCNYSISIVDNSQFLQHVYCENVTPEVFYLCCFMLFFSQNFYAKISQKFRKTHQLSHLSHFNSNFFFSVCKVMQTELLVVALKRMLSFHRVFIEFFILFDCKKFKLLLQIVLTETFCLEFCGLFFKYFDEN